MDEPIISVDAIRRKARNEYRRGVPRDDHNLDEHSPALPVWLDEWDLCAAAEAAVLKVKPMLARAGVTPP